MAQDIVILLVKRTHLASTCNSQILVHVLYCYLLA